MSSENSGATEKVVYDDKVVGQGLVYFMFKNRKSSDSLFVQFYDSRDLYELDVATDTLTRVLCSTAGESDCDVEPGLSRGFAYQFSGNHADLGYIYVLTGDVVDNVTTSGLLIIDSDRNGTIDKTMQIVAADWGVYGLGSKTSYIPD